MFTVDWFRDKRITVMGLGIHGGGVGIAKWLRRHGAVVTATDLRDQHALATSIEELERTYLEEVRRIGKRRMHRIRYVLGAHPEELFAKADMVIRNPAVPRDHKLLALAKKNGVPVESDISLFFMLCPFPITAVSGTKGKTTTTTMLAAMCREADPRTVIGGNIRISPLDKLDRLLALAAKKRGVTPPPIVLELSSWQLEGLAPHRMSPHVGVLTTIVEDHLDRYDGIDDYARAKEICVAYQGKDDVAVLNADNARTAAIGRWHGQIKDAPNAGRRLWFSVRGSMSGDGCHLAGGKIMLRDGKKRIAVAPVSSLKIPGAHNRSNVLAAVAAAYAMRIPLAAVRKVVRTFAGVPYRLETTRTLRGILFVNDTAATAPDASVAAMATHAGKKKRVVLISGGADKNLPFGEWAKSVKKHVKHLVLFDGSATPKMEAALAAAGARTPRAGARSMREAVAEAVRHARRGDVVLLSPGCASFGVFKNEFDRGDQFTAIVKKLK